MLQDGRITRDGDGTLRTRRFIVPTPESQGWEVAVYDHFRAMALAIGAKANTPRRDDRDVLGGSTATFEIDPDHPHREEVMELLARTRRDVEALWHRVSDHNRASPPDPERSSHVSFYFGQYVTPHRAAGESDAPEGSEESDTPEGRIRPGGLPESEEP